MITYAAFPYLIVAVALMILGVGVIRVQWRADPLGVPLGLGMIASAVVIMVDPWREATFGFLALS